MRKIDRTGERHLTNEGYWIEIVNYRNCMDCDVKIDNRFILKNKVYSRIIAGQVLNPYHPTVFNKGYLGIGDYEASKNGRNTKVYNAWHGMIERCYSDRYQQTRPSYIGCEVHTDWHNFQIFAKWYYKNITNGFALDKDILQKGNKIYSPETCCFVPKEVNSLLTKCDKHRGDYPIGVSYDKRSGKFSSNMRIEGRLKFLGYFNTPEEAFEAYKIAKESEIRRIAEEYKNQITKECYEALMNYKVDIDD